MYRSDRKARQKPTQKHWLLSKLINSFPTVSAAVERRHRKSEEALGRQLVMYSKTLLSIADFSA
jgi:hypothetical protein